jgi:hypothetical protein
LSSNPPQRWAAPCRLQVECKRSFAGSPPCKLWQRSNWTYSWMIKGAIILIIYILLITSAIFQNSQLPPQLILSISCARFAFIQQCCWHKLHTNVKNIQKYNPLTKKEKI